MNVFPNKTLCNIKKKLTPEQVQAKERFLKECAQRSHHNAVKEEEAKSEEQAALLVPTEAIDRNNDGQRDRQGMRRDSESQGLTNEQNDRTNDEQKEGQRDRRTEGLNETQTEELKDGDRDRRENVLTEVTTGGRDEEKEQTVTQQQPVATPDVAGTRQSRDSNDGDPGTFEAGNADGQMPKGKEHKGKDSGVVALGDGDSQSEGGKMTQKDEEGGVTDGERNHQEDENFRSEEIHSPEADTKTITESNDVEGLDGAAEPELKFSNLLSGSPVAGRTRGKSKPKNVLEGKKINSSTDGDEKVGGGAEVLTASRQPTQGRRLGRTRRFTLEEQRGLRVWGK